MMKAFWATLGFLFAFVAFYILLGAAMFTASLVLSACTALMK